VHQSNLYQKSGALILLSITLLVSCSSLKPTEILPYEPSQNDFTPLPDWALDGGIYELTLRHFTPEGTFQAAIPKLDAIADMGIKTIWIMPFQPMGFQYRKGTHGSPYCQTDLRGVDPYYGTMSDFQAFRDRVHELGMKLILDITLNHTAFDHPWTETHPHWYERDDEGEILPVSSWFNDVASLDFGQQDLREELLDTMIYWIKDQNLDGFRLDAITFVPSDFWLWALPQVREIKPIILLAEAGEAMDGLLGFNLMYVFGTNNHAYYNRDNPMPILAASETINYEESGGIPYLRYLTNHDDVGIGTPVGQYLSRVAVEALAVFTYSLPGLPMIFNGMEVGSTTKLSVIDRNPIDWEEDPEARAFYRWYFRLWAQEKALRLGNFQGYTGPSPVLAYQRSYQGEHIGVVVNPSDRDLDFQLPTEWPSAKAIDLKTGASFSGEKDLILPPHSWLMLKW
jgi:glycosidase